MSKVDSSQTYQLYHTDKISHYYDIVENYNNNLDNLPTYNTTNTHGGGGDSFNTTNVYGSKNGTTNTTKKGSVTLTDDGEDDGKISIGTTVKAMGKGVVKTIVNGIKGLNPLKPENWGNILKMGVAIAVSVAFPPAGVAIAAIAGVKGAITVGKGISSACNATTDAEAEAAFEDVGSGAFQVGMAVVGARAGIKAMKGTAGSAMSELGKGAGLKATGKAFWSDVKTFGNGGYKAAAVKNAFQDAYKSSTGDGVLSKSADALKNGSKDLFKKTQVGEKYYENVEEGAKFSERAKVLKDSAKEIRQENSIARQVARDAENGTNNARAAANGAKRSAQQELDAFKNSYKKGADGKWINKAGETLDDAAREAQLNKLQKAFDEAKANSSNVNNVYQDAMSAADKMKPIQDQIAQKQTLLKNASKAEAKLLNEEIANLNKQLSDLGSQSGLTKAQYNTYTGRTNLYRTGMKNWSDAAEAAGYKSRFASAKPAMSTMFDPINEHDTFLMQQEGAYYYYC